MSSLVASRRGRRSPSPDDRGRRGPSLREIRLVGAARPSGPIGPGLPPEGIIHLLGRPYRIASSQGPGDRDPRGYVHLVACPDDPPRA